MLRLDMIHVNQKSRFTFCHSKPARLPKSVLIDRCMQEKQRSRSMSGGPKMHNDGKKTWGKCSWKRVSHRFHLLCSLDSLHAIWDVSTFAFFFCRRLGEHLLRIWSFGKNPLMVLILSSVSNQSASQNAVLVGEVETMMLCRYQFAILCWRGKCSKTKEWMKGQDLTENVLGL